MLYTQNFTHLFNRASVLLFEPRQLNERDSNAWEAKPHAFSDDKLLGGAAASASALYI